ncbi:hypothetical protein OE88DRAFT_1229524 [Heliocybe sulcata]|uniref:Uncharacterized protein n=1 Tax=Heliocybe sulcata TaxID=5364 RepID=A0A5C3MLV0_9AGAM|nr:hypothetical protein OE88DRAFT_1229524 [Heliocybe sulcata]
MRYLEPPMRPKLKQQFRTESLRRRAATSKGEAVEVVSDGQRETNNKSARRDLGLCFALARSCSAYKTSLDLAIKHRLPTMPSTEDYSIIELRGAALEWLGPGCRITIHGVEYEYADSDADDDSIDDAVGPGRMFGKLVKRVAAPLEMFFSICSDLLGNGPDAIFTRLMRREYPDERDYRRSKCLSWWIGRHRPHPSLRRPGNQDHGRLVQFAIDRRYKFSVRLTAAYYLLLLLRCAYLDSLSTILPLFHDALLRLCQEGSRRSIHSRLILRPLQEVVTFKRDLIHFGSCKEEEIPAIIMCAPALRAYRHADSLECVQSYRGSSENMTSMLVQHHWTFRLYLKCLNIHTRSEFEAMNQVAQTISFGLHPRLPDPNPPESGLKSVAEIWYDWLEGCVNDKKREMEMRYLIEHMVRTREQPHS